MLIKNFYKIYSYKLESGNTLEVKECVVNDRMIEEWKRENQKIKLIFFNKEYSDISFDDNVYEIHKFKSKYPGNSYIKFPLKLIKNDKYVSKIIMCGGECDVDGYILISKLDLRNHHKSMKKANKKEKEEYAKKLCLEKLSEYNGILSGKICEVIMKDKENNIVTDEILIGDKKINDFLWKYLPLYNPNFIKKYNYVLK